METKTNKYNISAMAQWTDKSPFNNKTKTVNDANSNIPINQYYKLIISVD